MKRWPSSGTKCAEDYACLCSYMHAGRLLRGCNPLRVFLQDSQGCAALGPPHIICCQHNAYLFYRLAITEGAWCPVLLAHGYHARPWHNMQHFYPVQVGLPPCYTLCGINGKIASMLVVDACLVANFADPLRLRA
jgi:hypothetical protein